MTKAHEIKFSTEQIVLRPRFTLLLTSPTKHILEEFKQSKSKQYGIVTKVIDHHVILKIAEANYHYWSPQLHLELEHCTSITRLKGLFDPNPTIWTLFMFLKFVFSGLFIGFGVWAASNYLLELPTALPITLCILMCLLGIAVYFVAQYGKKMGKEQMEELYVYMCSVVRVEEHSLNTCNNQKLNQDWS